MGDKQEPLLHDDTDESVGELAPLNPRAECLSEKRYTTIPASVFNLANTILGSGTLAMALGCKQAGIFLFLVLLIVLGTLSDLSIKLIFESVKLLKTAGPESSGHPMSAKTEEETSEDEEMSYSVLGQEFFGKVGALVAEWSVTLQQLGACIGYVVLFGDIFSPILSFIPGSAGDWLTANVWVVQVFIVVVIIFPLCLLRTMDALKYTSFLGIVGPVATALALAVYGISVSMSPEIRCDKAITNCGVNGSQHQHPPICSSDQELPANSTDWGPVRILPTDSSALLSVSFICFAFLCQQNSFPIYEELKDASVEKMNAVSRMAIGIAAFTYSVSGVFGYLAFLDATQDDVMRNFKLAGGSVDYVFTVIRSTFGVSLICSYPVVVWEARRNFTKLICGRCVRQSETGQLSFLMNLILNACIVGSTLLVGIVMSLTFPAALKVLLGFVGSTCSPLMVFVLPSAFYIKARRVFKVTDRKWLHVAAWVVFVVGTLSIPLGLVVWAIGVYCELA